MFGINILENRWLTEPGIPYEVYTYKKSKPPYRSFYQKQVVTPQVPSRSVICIGNQMYAHPALIAEIKNKLRTLE